MDLPKMRTAPEAIAMLKELDPDTAFTLRALRRMMKNGEIPVVNIASQRLIDFNVLLEYLHNGTPSTGDKMLEYGKIRRIPER